MTQLRRLTNNPQLLHFIRGKCIFDCVRFSSVATVAAVVRQAVVFEAIRVVIGVLSILQAVGVKIFASRICQKIHCLGNLDPVLTEFFFGFLFQVPSVMLLHLLSVEILSPEGVLFVFQNLN